VPKNAGKSGTGGDTMPTVWAKIGISATEQRWQDATEIGQRHGLICTGGLDAPVCNNHSAVALVVDHVLVAAPCREHAEALVVALLERGKAGLRLVPLVVMVEERGWRFKASVDYLRQTNRTAGFTRTP
jgi:hypothetical protein